MKEIEWHLAGVFDCEECGRETFFRCILIGPDSDGDYLVKPPKTLECKHCHAKFEPMSDCPEV